MQTKEEKICTFTQNNKRLQLLKIIYKYDAPEVFTHSGRWEDIMYQVRLNRKIIKTSISEYEMRKLFAMYCQNIVLQLKIY